MNILYDHQIFTSQDVGGISRYFYEVIKELSPENKALLPFFACQNLYLKEDKDLKSAKFFYNGSFKGYYTLLGKHIDSINEKIIIKQLRKERYDVFHPTYYDTYFLDYCKKPFVTTIHDMIPEYSSFGLDKNKVDFSNELIRNKKEHILQSSKIIAVSEYTKNDILKIYDIASDKIKVIYHDANKPTTKYLPNTWGKYLLYVGKRGGYKNFDIFIKSITELLTEDKDLNLVCVGSPFNASENTLFQSLNISHKIQSIQADDITLNSLYHYARVFVYPSSYEGFGIPILEAFANGCPCCISEATCFPEVADNAAVYFAPNDEQTILNAIKKIVYNDSERNKLITKGQERLKQFSWKKAAQETEDVYRKIIK